MASSISLLVSLMVIVQLAVIAPGSCQQAPGSGFASSGLSSNFFNVLSQLKNLNGINAQNPDATKQSSSSSSFVAPRPTPLLQQSPSAALLSALAQNPNAASSLSNLLRSQASQIASSAQRNGKSSPFDNLPGFNDNNDNRNDVSITDTSADNSKPFFYARCRDCNIALGEKEVMSFLQDIVEMMAQPGQNYFADARGKRAFDGECVNCNLLLGGQEALTAAANSMFSSLKNSPPKHNHFR